MSDLSAVPPTPDRTTAVPRVSNVKPATPESVQLNNKAESADTMTSLIFEDIGGQELLSITRNDLINGQSVVYNPIKNASLLDINYGPSTIIPISSDYFNRDVLRLSDYFSSAGEIVEIDYLTGDLTATIEGLYPNQQIEFEILYAPDPQDDIIWDGD